MTVSRNWASTKAEIGIFTIRWLPIEKACSESWADFLYASKSSKLWQNAWLRTNSVNLHGRVRWKTYYLADQCLLKGNSLYWTSGRSGQSTNWRHWSSSWSKSVLMLRCKKCGRSQEASCSGTHPYPEATDFSPEVNECQTVDGYWWAHWASADLYVVGLAWPCLSQIEQIDADSIELE